MRFSRFLVLSALCCGAAAIPALAQSQGPVRITLDDAIKMALEHNHALQAARTTIQQSQAEEDYREFAARSGAFVGRAVSAVLSAEPVLEGTYFDQIAQFDIGLGYLFERGRKRQHRLQAALDVTAQTKSQVADNERALTFLVASEFVSVQLAEATVSLAEAGFEEFSEHGGYQRSPSEGGRHERRRLSEDQAAVAAIPDGLFAGATGARAGARVAAAIAWIRVVCRRITTWPVSLIISRCSRSARIWRRWRLRQRPDLRAAQQGVTAAQSQFELQKAIGKRDLNASANYSHTAGISSASVFFSIQLPIFDRNQGEIARTRYAIAQSQETEKSARGAGADRRAQFIRKSADQRSNHQALSLGLSRCSEGIAGHQRVRLQARRREPARFSRCRDAVIARRSSPTCSLSRLTRRRWSNCARRWAQGICHEENFSNTRGIEPSREAAAGVRGRLLALALRAAAATIASRKPIR